MSRVNYQKSYYSEELKQRLVVATNQPGASPSKIARQSGISLSALYKWRRQYQELTTAATLIPIAIQATEETSADSKLPVDTSASEKAIRSPGTIEVILQRARIQICGLVDSDALRVVLQACQDG